MCTMDGLVHATVYTRLDFASDIFDHGQAYVALSTVMMLETVSWIGLIRASSDKYNSGAHDDYSDVY